LRSQNGRTRKGYFAICQDTENNTFALWEWDERAR
jgi:predicted enzyme related to lactoylglutathione lyase